MSRLPAIIFVVLTIACSGSEGFPTIDELRGQEFAEPGEIIEGFDCHTWYAVFDLGPATTETEAQAIANAELGRSGYDVRVATVVRAGDVWLLVDSDGLVFGGMAVQGGIEACLD